MKRVKPLNNNGSILLKVQIKGHTYRVTPIPGGKYSDPSDVARANIIALQMGLDISSGCFDTSLNKYQVHKPDPPIATPKKLLDLWDMWVDSLKLPESTKADHYEMVRRQITKSSPGLIETDWFTRCTLAPATYNTRLGFLRRCLSWAVRSGMVVKNPWVDCKPRKSAKKQIQPFTLDELSRILEGFRSMHPHYYGLITFLALTGCRLSEAIGLRWSDINFVQGTFTISEALPINKAGNGYERVRKETKTGSATILDLNDSLRSLLESMNPQSTGLIFESEKGCQIGNNAVRDRWVEVLEAQGIPYRKLHTLRHTLASHAIEQGKTLAEVAYLLGHSSIQMVSRNYGHAVNRPQLPDIQL